MAFPPLETNVQTAIKEHSFPMKDMLFRTMYTMYHHLKNSSENGIIYYLAFAPWLQFANDKKIANDKQKTNNNKQIMNDKQQTNKILPLIKQFMVQMRNKYDMNDNNKVLHLAILLITMQTFGYAFVKAFDHDTITLDVIKEIISKPQINRVNTKQIIFQFIQQCNKLLITATMNKIINDTRNFTQNVNRINRLYIRNKNKMIRQLNEQQIDWQLCNVSYATFKSAINNTNFYLIDKNGFKLPVKYENKLDNAMNNNKNDNNNVKNEIATNGNICNKNVGKNDNGVVTTNTNNCDGCKNEILKTQLNSQQDPIQKTKVDIEFSKKTESQIIRLNPKTIQMIPTMIQNNKLNYNTKTTIH